MGAWHESLNLAALWRLPVVFLVVNNSYGMGTSVERASAEPELFKRAAAPTGCTASGSTATTSRRCSEATERLLARAREERAPAVLEAMTYRYPRPLGRRRRAQLPNRRRDRGAPGARSDRALPGPGFSSSGVTAEELDLGRGARRRAVEAAVAFAEQRRGAPGSRSSPPGMYAPGSDEQFERMLPGSPHGERELVFAGGLVAVKRGCRSEAEPGSCAGAQ